MNGAEHRERELMCEIRLKRRKNKGRDSIQRWTDIKFRNTYKNVEGLKIGGEPVGEGADGDGIGNIEAVEQNVQSFISQRFDGLQSSSFISSG